MAHVDHPEHQIEIVKLADWLNWCSGRDSSRYVALPMIQRGSVWKPHQIIDLWDSLLRGMPIGGLMINTVPQGTRVRKVGSAHTETLNADGIGLLDGQQRTLAMLAGWPPGQDLKIWVDITDSPGKEHLFRLRVTTKNHPFGFQREAPSAKLSMEDRRKAYAIYCSKNNINIKSELPLPDIELAFPFCAQRSLPLELHGLIDGTFKYENKKLWLNYVSEKCKEIKHYQAVWNKEVRQYDVTCHAPWSAGIDAEIEGRLDALYEALIKLRNLSIPLIRIDNVISAKEESDGSDPALAILFRRVGSGGTPLTNDDYVFSIIKHRCPETHDLVEDIYKDKNVAALLMPVDIVSAAVRLAVMRCRDDKKLPLPDHEQIDKNQFHRLLGLKVYVDHEESSGSFLEHAFLPLIEKQDGDKSRLAGLFDVLHDLLLYQGPNDIGLPVHGLVLLDKPLIQVLLFWLMRMQDQGVDISGLNGCRPDKRRDLLRFVLYWAVFVFDARKASRLAFSIIRGHERIEDLEWKEIYSQLIVENSRCGYRLYSPDKVKGSARQSVEAVAEKGFFVGWRRFSEAYDQSGQDSKHCRELYHRWWTHGRGYVHPILLWLQREYVISLPGNPVAGREEDTPYDYDHILPQSHWSNWTGVGGSNRILDFMDPADKAYHVTGNGIGNVRVWASSLNRADGDMPPRDKLDSPEFRQHSLIIEADETDENGHWSMWVGCSGEDGKVSVWDSTRVEFFQKAVEKRAFYLYQKYFDDLEFELWVG